MSPDTAHILSALTLIALFTGVITVQCLVYSYNALPSDNVVNLATRAANMQMQATGQINTQVQELTNTITAAKTTAADMQCAVKAVVVEASKGSEQLMQKVLNTTTSASVANDLVKEAKPLSEAPRELVSFKAVDIVAQSVAKTKTNVILKSPTVCTQKSVSSSTQCADVLVDSVMTKNCAIMDVTSAVKKIDACTQTVEQAASCKNIACAESLSNTVAGTVVKSSESTSCVTTLTAQVKKLNIADTSTLKPKIVDTAKLGVNAQDVVTLSSSTTVASACTKTKAVEAIDVAKAVSKTKIVSSIDATEELKQASVVTPLTRSAKRALKKAARRSRDKAAKQSATTTAQQSPADTTKSVPETVPHTIAPTDVVVPTGEKAGMFSIGNLRFVDHGMEHAADHSAKVLTVGAPAGSDFGKILNKMDTVSVVNEPISQLVYKKLALLQVKRRFMHVKVIESLEEFSDLKPGSIFTIHCLPILVKSVAKRCTKRVVSLYELVESLLG